MTKHARHGVLLSAVFAVLLCGCEPSGELPSPNPPADVVAPPSEDQLDIIHPLAFGQKDGKPVVIGCSERIVEVPYVLRHLPYPFRGRLLDVGYLESEIIYQTASLGFDTWGIDIRPTAAEFPGVHYVQGDVIKYPFEASSFDVVIALSTVEHIGLHAYGNLEADPEGDLHALQAIRRILKPGGRLLLTVPFGRRGSAEWYRVYDHDALQGLLKGAGFRAVAEDYWTKQGAVSWVPTPWKEAEQVDSISHHVMAVACLVARPLAKGGH